LPVCGANRRSVAEPKTNGRRNRSTREAKWQARNVDPGMEAVKAAAVAGEGKAVTSIRPRPGESCSALGSFDPVIAKAEIGRNRKAGWLAAGPAERFDPKGCNSPEGEWRPGTRQAGFIEEAVTGLKR